MIQKYCCSIALIVFLTIAAQAQNDTKSVEILQKARNELKIPTASDVESIRIKSLEEFQNEQDGIASTSSASSLVEFKRGKMRRETSTLQQSGARLNSIEIINRNERSYDSMVLRNGTRTKVVLGFGRTKEQAIAASNRKAWELLFPIFLQSNLFGAPYNELEFKYVGVADSGAKKASILETKFDNYTYQYFFDIDLNRLLMVWKTEEFDNGKKLVTKYYYSDYRNESGFTFPHKLNYQVGSSSSRRVEIVIEKLELNPEIEPSRFKI